MPLLRNPGRVPIRYHLDVMTRFDETAGEVGRVTLHPTDSVHVAGNRDDADSH